MDDKLFRHGPDKRYGDDAMTASVGYFKGVCDATKQGKRKA
ncbi:hypothetical protein [Spirosoma humi]